MAGTAFPDIVGFLAALASTASFGPQAIKVIVSRSVGDLSARTYGLTVAAFALWVAYGAMRGDWALVASNLVCLVLSGFILLMICLPARRRAQVIDAVERNDARG